MEIWIVVREYEHPSMEPDVWLFEDADQAHRFADLFEDALVYKQPVLDGDAASELIVRARFQLNREREES